MPRIKRKTRSRARLTPADLTILELLALKCGWGPTLKTRWRTLDEVREAWETLRPHFHREPGPGVSAFLLIDADHWAARKFDLGAR